jgi:hypothetical protein
MLVGAGFLFRHVFPWAQMYPISALLLRTHDGTQWHVGLSVAYKRALGADRVR